MIKVNEPSYGLEGTYLGETFKENPIIITPSEYEYYHRIGLRVYFRCGKDKISFITSKESIAELKKGQKYNLKVNQEVL